MIPDLSAYDYIVVSSSAGKDSQAALDEVCGLCRDMSTEETGDLTRRIVVVHADLGQVEWEGTLELAFAQAEHYGVRFEVVSRLHKQCKRTSGNYAAGETYGDILDYTRRRGKWPSSKQRWCTSDFKRAPILAFFTSLAEEFRTLTGIADRPCRILDVQGLRAQESSTRAAKRTYTLARVSTRTQLVDTWLPIHDWSEDQVWGRIRASKCPHHRAYDLGMPRLSCCFCIFAPKAALVLAGKHNPKLLDLYLQVEQETGHDFKVGCSIASIKEAIENDEAQDSVESWSM